MLSDWRLSWDQYFIEIAKVVATRADCRRRAVGAVVVDSRHHVVGTGYNGVRPGEPGCITGACPRGRMSYDELPAGGSYDTCIATHAEANAITYSSPTAQGCTVYVTREPCDGCWKLMKRVGVSRVVWITDSGDRRTWNR